VTVSFVLDRTGHVLATGIVKSSGDSSFDEAALAMFRRAESGAAAAFAGRGATFEFIQCKITNKIFAVLLK
jgi:periplasmic protein TonB